MSNPKWERLELLRGDIRAGFEAIARGEFEEHDRKTTKALAADIKRPACSV